MHEEDLKRICREQYHMADYDGTHQWLGLACLVMCGLFVLTGFVALVHKALPIGGQ